MMRDRLFLRFLLTGLVNTAVGYALFAALLLSGARPLLAVAMATALGALFNFLSIGIVVFRNADVMLLPRFLAVYVVQCGVNSAALSALAAIGVGPLIGQFLLLPPLAIVTFLAMRSMVFRQPA